jgi:ceramide glucosyltransferase
VCSRDDPSFPILEKLIDDFRGFDAKILVEEEDPNLQQSVGAEPNLGPNPKIRNMSRGYREAKGDVLWIIDCNVWVGKGVGGRMVDKLNGLKPEGGSNIKYKFVHLLPLVVETAGGTPEEEAHGLLSGTNGPLRYSGTADTALHRLMLTRSNPGLFFDVLTRGGGRLEELFLSSSHAKFYTAINTVLLAPCIVGKSNMFRRSHLDALTSNLLSLPAGIDHFSSNICEDHLIGDLLWRNSVPAETDGEKHGKHALVFGDLAIQPMANMSIPDYVARRVRWLRVRKFTVVLATLVEPGTESLLCSAYGGYAFTTLPIFRPILGHFLGGTNTWAAFIAFFLASVTIWAAVDYTVYILLHSATSIEVDEHTPSFAKPPGGGGRRSFGQWLAAWVGREVLAGPIWLWAVFGGTTVVWRGRIFRVGFDMRVHEIVEEGSRKDRND